MGTRLDDIEGRIEAMGRALRLREPRQPDWKIKRNTTAPGLWIHRRARTKRFWLRHLRAWL